MNNENKKGDTIISWRTPEERIVIFDLAPYNLTHFLPSIKYKLNHASNELPNPNSNETLRRTLFITLLNVFAKSMYIITT